MEKTSRESNRIVDLEAGDDDKNRQATFIDRQTLAQLSHQNHHEAYQNEPIISFEALCFLMGISVGLLQIIQNVDKPQGIKTTCLFFTGAAICGLGLTLILRIIFGVEIKRKDTGVWFANIDWLILLASLMALVFALPIICIGIDEAGGYCVWVIGFLVGIPTLNAYFSAQIYYKSQQQQSGN